MRYETPPAESLVAYGNDWGICEHEVLIDRGDRPLVVLQPTSGLVVEPERNAEQAGFGWLPAVLMEETLGLMP